VPNGPPTETPRSTDAAPRISGIAEPSAAAEKPGANDAKAEPRESESGSEAAARATSAQRFELPPVAASEGPMQALWVGDELVFARRVAVGGRVLVQGAWLDWSELRAWLLSRVTDLLPSAQLEPAPEEPSPLAVEATRRLAFIPARLVPGTVAVAAASSWSPLQISLSAAWGSAVIGALALALLLHGTLRLSERRGAFVSAVTHELRTPLTTFRMYTEMLAGGMVPDEAKRRGYIDTLRKEAERLSHLVENVLSYARLERGRASARVEETTPGELLARIEERLRQRAQQGGLTLRIEFRDDAAERPLRTDTTAVEQILFNLVDNAAKYARHVSSPASLAGAAGPATDAADSHPVIASAHGAAAVDPAPDAEISRPGPAAPDPASESTLTIAIARGARNRGIAIRVSDNGPGIATSVRRRLFQPFSKSATEAAHSQPGVGLGLALSRRLARDELHGDLALERTGSDGTVFRLELPGA
jgi:signal transduction histidine kinase